MAEHPWTPSPVLQNDQSTTQLSHLGTSTKISVEHEWKQEELRQSPEAGGGCEHHAEPPHTVDDFGQTALKEKVPGQELVTNVLLINATQKAVHKIQGWLSRSPHSCAKQHFLERPGADEHSCISQQGVEDRLLMRLPVPLLQPSQAHSSQEGVTDLNDFTTPQ